MPKFKTILSWLLVIVTVLLSFVLFPFFSSKLPQYIGNKYYHDVYKPRTINTTKYIDEIFPWQYYDESKTALYQDFDVIDAMEKQAESFLLTTMFMDMNISLDFSQYVEESDSNYLYVHDYKLIVDNKEYFLDLSYDTESKLIVMLHCDSGGVYDRNVIAEGETKLREIISVYEESREYSDESKVEFIIPDNISTSSEPISDYLFHLALIFNEIDIYSIKGDTTALKLDGKNLCLCFEDERIVLYWNPYSCEFEGYSINISH